MNTRVEEKEQEQGEQRHDMEMLQTGYQHFVLTWEDVSHPEKEEWNK